MAARRDDHARSARDTLAAVELELAQLLRRAEGTRVSGTPRTAGRTAALDRSGYLILHALATHGPQNVHVLADRLGLDASTVTRQVVALEREGHVLRARDPDDGRAVLVEPTEPGLDVLALHRAARGDLYADVLADWSRLDRALLAELLGRLNADLDAFRRRDAR
ncbi:MarR family winged helix-turn-helix transcriptional regulator [Cellulosimicrobium marinum]|uniref:MarR family winged helix-turn-helix transcriptional regulator n=1 Tax=Cellulosimicrobium marinum TaxID=1638992 RepID=UPI001E65A97C|nr:MarR family transcriptional regulator [Cellulosimicrobium marinum]MCB7137084.1 MarR family transcriptional regulator [Cellulosimicrobium marinum]